MNTIKLNDLSRRGRMRPQTFMADLVRRSLRSVTNVAVLVLAAMITPADAREPLIDSLEDRQQLAYRLAAPDGNDDVSAPVAQFTVVPTLAPPVDDSALEQSAVNDPVTLNERSQPQQLRQSLSQFGYDLFSATGAVPDQPRP